MEDGIEVHEVGYDHKGEHIAMPMIIPKLHLLEVEGKLGRGDPVVLDQPLLGIAPEPLQAVEGDLPSGEAAAMFLSILKELHKARLLEYRPDGKCAISPKSMMEAEAIALRQFPG